MPGLYWPKSMLGARRAAKKYEAAVMPYHEALVKVKLPARRAAGALDNYARVAAVAKAMRRTKLAR